MDTDKISVFYDSGAISINNARILHLEYLNLPFKDSIVFETGCGAKGDFTRFLIEKEAKVILNDTRKENIVNNLKNNISKNIIDSNNWDLNNINHTDNDIDVDVVFCYGTLYHLHNPENFIQYTSKIVKKFMILSTVVTQDIENNIVYLNENSACFNQSSTGSACRPSRKWLFDTLKKYYDYVYISIKQPNHGDYPVDWTQSHSTSRCVFLASKIPVEQIENQEGKWTTFIPTKQEHI